MTAVSRRREASWPRLQCLWPISLALLLVTALPVAAVFAGTSDESAEEEEEPSPYRGGLIARYTGTDGVARVRLEDDVAFAWGVDAPERRVPPGPFSAQFSGHLDVRAAGQYRLHVFAAGAVRLELNGSVLIDATSPKPGWLDSEPIELPFGTLPIEVRYRRTNEPARLALFWEGPQFELEPITARWLLHDAEQTPDDAFERGTELVRALRCAACHEIPGEQPVMPAPAVNSLAGNISRAWLVDWLEGVAGKPDDAIPAGPDEHGNRDSRRMPHFGFSHDESEAIAEFLLSTSEKTRFATPVVGPARAVVPAKKKKKDEPEIAPPEPNAAIGGTLFRSLGCLACHRVGELGNDGLFGGGDLSQVAHKRPADFFARWLADPAAINANHRMPIFALDPPEIESLSLYLRTLGDEVGPPASSVSGQTERGRELVREARCGECHTLPTSAGSATTKAIAKLRPPSKADDTDSCLFEPKQATHRPGYRLSADERRFVSAFLADAACGSAASSARPRRQLLAEHNCLACHTRGPSQGLAARLSEIGDADPALRDLLAALAPPALTGVGDKLHDSAIVAAMTVSEPPRQTWLRVRMPKFPLDKATTHALAQHLIDTDRIPDRPGAPRPAATQAAGDAALEAAGPRLVTADGFGCTSCHAIGKWTPEKVAINAQGADLSQIGERVRRPWFDRWVHNPARIVPQMEMPSVQQSVRGVLDGKLDRQLAAVWQVLNRRDFTPPSPSALRVVRRANIPELKERAAVVTDLVEAGGRPFVRPLAIGLANRHNVLVDLASNRLAAWWMGDTAREQTRGKSWYWEAGMPQLLAVPKKDAPLAASELALLHDEQRILPTTAGDYLSEFDALEHVPGGIRFTQRLRFGEPEPSTTLAVEQTFTVLPGETPSGKSGFRRRVAIGATHSDVRTQLLVLAGDVSIDVTGRMATLGSDGSSKRTGHRGPALQVVLQSPAGARLIKTAEGAAITLPLARETATACELDYLADVVADQFAPLPQPDRSVARQDLKVVPGYEAVRLPVTDEAMPTGLAWRGDGTLVVSSLEGRIWLGHDSDGDGLVDRLAPFSDELAAPFGVAISGDAIDAINKYGLVRLSDNDGDGRADRTELVASGWGHTRDYHDWAVGLPRDAAGNYYVSLPCQQDDRSEAGAKLRGTVVKLVPHTATSDDPRRFTIEQLAGGLRFPQGIALSEAEELFVTDNQGNYTPFNELNHITTGARYGFINRLEFKRGLNPPFRTAAVEIPHPWTRSVNGICFLPADRGQHGPFAGHLIGCEYDTRRLVRMSLEQVAGEFQGAVYPFSIEPTAGEETFEGPLTCQVAPSGDLYVGNIRDSGWGAGANTGSLVRLRANGQLPAGIAEVRAHQGGFAIEFTQPLDRARVGSPSSYAISSYRRESTPAYGGPDLERRAEKVRTVEVAEDGRRVTITLGDLREGFVYEFHLRNLVGKGAFFPAEAYYTLRHRLP
jgi:mono/diheme cytochrome c family protein